MASEYENPTAAKAREEIRIYREFSERVRKAQEADHSLSPAELHAIASDGR
jgi:hypothetical protein